MAESLNSTQSAGQAFAITPNTDNDLAVIPRALYVGVTGDLIVAIISPVTNTRANVTFTAVPAGALLPIRPVRVLATSTASAIVGLS